MPICYSVDEYVFHKVVFFGQQALTQFPRYVRSTTGRHTDSNFAYVPREIFEICPLAKCHSGCRLLLSGRVTI